MPKALSLENLVRVLAALLLVVFISTSAWAVTNIIDLRDKAARAETREEYQKAAWEKNERDHREILQLLRKADRNAQGRPGDGT